MNHLKTYESFINGVEQTETILTLKDICLELEDEGFSIQFFGNKQHFVVLSIDKDDDGENLLDYHWGEIDSIVQRIITYLGDRVKNIRYCQSGAGSFKTMDISKNPQPTMELYDFVIEFTN